MPSSIPHTHDRKRSVVLYDSSHPSVIFGKIKAGVLRQWNQNKMVQSVHRWLKPASPKKRYTISVPDTRKSSGLILPEKGQSLMLIQNSDMMSDLLAENDRLRNIVDQLIRQDNREKIISPPR